MKAKDLRELNNNEIESRLHQDEEELFNLRMKMKTTEITNNRQFRFLKRNIARIKTLQNERKGNQE
ncbi:50S ribosomal protein L29 [candidate division WOR-3 bacterium]|nr:50S ribosomal protein L29 [candidate division WOR-3 bacterium]